MSLLGECDLWFPFPWSVNHLPVLARVLKSKDRIYPSAETITLLLEKVLKLNNFTFRDLNYI